MSQCIGAAEYVTELFCCAILVIKCHLTCHRNQFRFLRFQIDGLFIENNIGIDCVVLDCCNDRCTAGLRLMGTKTSCLNNRQMFDRGIPWKQGTYTKRTNGLNSFGAKFQTTFVVCFFILTNYRLERRLYVKLID